MMHAPKQRALEAYVAEQLSGAGAARVERHLAGCARCRETLGVLRAYAVLREDASSSDAPLLDWARLEAALPANAPAKPARTRGKVLALGWPALALAATFAVAWLGLSGRPAESPNASPAQVATRVSTPKEQPLRGRVTLVSGTAELTRAGEPAPLRVDAEIDAESLLASGPGSSVHVVLSDGTGFMLGENTQLWVQTLSSRTTVLALRSGRIESQVHKLRVDERYEVLVGDVAVRVRGTHFVVEREDNDLAVSVQEGRVEVARGSEQLALLSPGETYKSRDRGVSKTATSARPVHDLLGFQLPRHALELPPMQQVRAWLVDGERVTAEGQLAMRLPPGRNELHFEDLRGQLRSVEIDVNAPWTTLSAGGLSKLLFPHEERVGYLPPERIAQVLKQGVHALRRCYEHSLRQSPSLEGKITLAVRVAADGHVARAQAKGASELPHELARCIAQQAGSLVFPKPEGGGAVSFEVPLNLKASR